jgi:hypothetical protein
VQHCLVGSEMCIRDSHRGWRRSEETKESFEEFRGLGGGGVKIQSQRLWNGGLRRGSGMGMIQENAKVAPLSTFSSNTIDPEG